MKYACIIPCFNEVKRIEDIFIEINSINNKYLDWFILDNGSTDESYELMNKSLELFKNKNIYIIRKEKNNGYGAGIKFIISLIFSNKIGTNLIQANDFINSYKAIGWTHADGQTPLRDILSAQKILEKQKDNHFLIKGIRVQRNDKKISKLFTSFLSLIQILFFNKNIISHNSQPTFVSTELLNKIFLDTQNSGLFDLSVSILSLSYKCQIKRFPVIFYKRKSGDGANEKIMQKIGFSIENIKFLWKMRGYSRLYKKN